MSQKLDQTYYEILEVSPDAPVHVIQQAYHRAKETYSPDSPALYTMFTAEEARDLLSLIDEAYSVLSNQSKRQIYDQQLAREKRDPGYNASTGKEALPDFNPPPEAQKDSPPPPSVKMTLSSSAKSSSSTTEPTRLPEGFARTRFSVYEVNKLIEEEILNQKDYDGAFLRKVRSYKNINLDQLSSETRISRPYLVALEANDYEALPAPVFTRGFVVQVARALGLKEQVAASSYMELYKKVKGHE